MDQHTKLIQRLQGEAAVKALRRNRFDAHYFETVEQMKTYVSELLQKDMTVAVGGSMTLFETGIIDMIRGSEATFYDRYDVSKDTAVMFRKAFESDLFFTSSNAVTLDGQLFNIDGNGNRVAAMIFGPKKVVVIVGTNKIVKDMSAAESFAKMTSRPMNNQRLNTGNPCTVTGECMECVKDTRICSAFVRIARSQIDRRIAVLIVNESLGYGS